MIDPYLHGSRARNLEVIPTFRRLLSYGPHPSISIRNIGAGNDLCS